MRYLWEQLPAVAAGFITTIHIVLSMLTILSWVSAVV